ncbi:MAG: Rid family detoxifying hydrolase [Flavobacteriales bacterium]|jgi:2-iminobutanoate/2-iminopropanoate deaminase|nr:Rid family detoxifying hydrolase [Flavobacteriales bacterium]
MKKTINIPNAPVPVGPYSQAVEYNGLLIASGQIAINPIDGILNTASISEELTQIFKNIDALLAASKLERENILKCSIFLKNMDDFEVVNKIYSNFFNEPYPARETVQVSRLPKDANIEISFIAGK